MTTFRITDAPTGYLVRVVTRHHRMHGECGCGWRGPQHWLKAAAVIDALTHEYYIGHTVAMPLVVKDAAR